MSIDDDGSKQDRKRVGVYDRPASADRFRHLRVVVLVIAAIASVASLYFFFSS